MVIFVEGGLGAPLASVKTREMTVVEGHTVTMVCQATGMGFPSLLCAECLYRASLIALPLHHRQPSSCDHLVQAASAVTVETHGCRWSVDTDQRGAPRFRAIHLQRHQRARLQRGLHADGGGV